MVKFLRHALSYHVAEELNDADDDSSIEERIRRAFILTDIHGRKKNILSSGATVALCLVKVPVPLR